MLLTKDIERRLPPLYAHENDKPDQVPVVVKFFTPDSSWTWFATEYDPAERLFFGYVVGMESELGYFSLAELESARGPMGLPIERDRYFGPATLAQVMDGTVR